MFGAQGKAETKRLAHARWSCKYHMDFAPEHRRQAIYGRIQAGIGCLLRKLCENKGIV